MPKQTIDKSLRISWAIQFEDGTFWFNDSQEDRCWIKAKELVQGDRLKIRRMHLFSTQNTSGDTQFDGVLTSEYPPGIFFSNKMVAQLAGPTVYLFGIGEILESDTTQVDIRWYDEGMGLRSREQRSVEKSQLGLIYNNLT